MDASMGRPSNFHTGSTGVPKAALPAEKSTDPSPTDPKHVKSLVDGLKGLLGIDHTPAMGEKNPANAASVQEALGRGIAEGTKAGPE